MSYARPRTEAISDIMAVDLHNEGHSAGSKLIEKSKSIGGPAATATIKSHTYTLGKHNSELKRGPISGSNP
jgi:hypothetical protein